MDAYKGLTNVIRHVSVCETGAPQSLFSSLACTTV
jgi:hypothetical protein